MYLEKLKKTRDYKGDIWSLDEIHSSVKGHYPGDIRTNLYHLLVRCSGEGSLGGRTANMLGSRIKG